jgi:PPM family protein phosphatase
MSGVPDAVWIGGIAFLVFAVVYMLARRSTRVSTSSAPAPVTASASASASTAAAAPEPAKSAMSSPGAPPKAESPAPPQIDPDRPSVVRTSTGEDAPALPKIAFEEEEDEVDPTKVGLVPGKSGVQKTPTHSILHDEDATVDEPTQPQAMILVIGLGQTDKGKRRKRNEDSILSLPELGVYAVADGMGGYQGGDIASKLAAQTLEDAFRRNKFDGSPHEWLPRRASELARAIQMANEAILKHAESDKELEGMGTTVCAARFSPNKQRLYIGHVGDSRMYRMRASKLEQLTKDHVMGALGATGSAAGLLSRAVGIWPVVPVDVVLCKPRPGDIYLLCSDGLTKMVRDVTIEETLAKPISPQAIVDELIEVANAHGGADNISVIVIRVAPTGVDLAAPS